MAHVRMTPARIEELRRVAGITPSPLTAERDRLRALVREAAEMLKRAERAPVDGPPGCLTCDELVYVDSHWGTEYQNHKDGCELAVLLNRLESEAFKP